MAGLSGRARSPGLLRSVLFVSRTPHLWAIESPTDSFHSPAVKSGIWVSNNSPESHPPPPPPTRAPHLSVCCCHLLSTLVKSLMRGQAQRETLSSWWMRTVLGEKRMGREEKAADIYFFPKLVLEQPPQRWGWSGSLCNPFQFL